MLKKRKEIPKLVIAWLGDKNTFIPLLDRIKRHLKTSKDYSPERKTWNDRSI